MDVLNSHLPSGSLRAWLLATGKGRQKSTNKSVSASKWCGIWTSCLKAEGGGTACSNAPSRRSWLCDINSDEVGSCCHLIVGLRGTKAFHGISKNACGTSAEVTGWSALAEKTAGGWSMFMPIVFPLTPKLSSSRRSNPHLLIPQRYYCIQDALYTVCLTLQYIHSQRTCPNFIHETIWYSMGNMG